MDMLERHADLTQRAQQFREIAEESRTIMSGWTLPQQAGHMLLELMREGVALSGTEYAPLRGQLAPHEFAGQVKRYFYDAFMWINSHVPELARELPSGRELDITGCHIIADAIEREARRIAPIPKWFPEKREHRADPPI